MTEDLEKVYISVTKGEALIESFKALGRREDYKKMAGLSVLSALLPFGVAVGKAFLSGRASESVASQKLVEYIQNGQAKGVKEIR